MKHDPDLMRALYEFTLYRELSMPQYMRFSQAILNKLPSDLTSATMQFLIMFATNSIVDNILLRTFEAFTLTNKALKNYNEETIDRNDPEFSDLIRLRNKILSHKVENEIETDSHKNWKNSNYNSSEKVIALAMSCADRINEKIIHLLENDKSADYSGSVHLYNEFNNEDLSKIFEALKVAEIY